MIYKVPDEIKKTRLGFYRDEDGNLKWRSDDGCRVYSGESVWDIPTAAFQFNLTALMMECFPVVHDCVNWAVLNPREKPVAKTDDVYDGYLSSKPKAVLVKEAFEKGRAYEREVALKFASPLSEFEKANPEIVKYYIEKGKQAGRVFNCKCVRGDTSTKICECYIAGADAMYDTAQEKVADMLVDKDKQIAQLQDEVVMWRNNYMELFRSWL
jgi:hypothetical protein